VGKGATGVLQAVVAGSTPQEFAAEIRHELERMRRAVAAAKIEVN
jgi:hypothetical protein